MPTAVPEGKHRIEMSIKRRKEWWVFRPSELDPSNHRHYGYYNNNDIFLLKFHDEGRLVTIYVYRNGKALNQYHNGNRASVRHQRMAEEIVRRDRPVLLDPNNCDEDGQLRKYDIYRPVYISPEGQFQAFADLDIER